MRDNHDNDGKFKDNVINLFGDQASDENEDSASDSLVPEDPLVFDEQETEQFEVAVEATPKSKSFLSSSVFLNTRNAQILPKIMNEIHLLSKRYACIPFEQMASQLESVEDIWSLGEITIVLTDILNISPEQRSLVAAYLKRSNSLSDLGPELNEVPLFLIGSSSPLKALLETEMIDSSFAKQIESCVIEADRLPLKTAMLKSTLELFLEPGAIL